MATSQRPTDLSWMALTTVGSLISPMSPQDGPMSPRPCSAKGPSRTANRWTGSGNSPCGRLAGAHPRSGRPRELSTVSEQRTWCAIGSAEKCLGGLCCWLAAWPALRSQREGPLKESNKMLVVIILGGIGRKMTLPLIKVHFRFSPVTMQALHEPARHFDGPNAIGCSVAQKKRKLVRRASPRPGSVAAVSSLPARVSGVTPAPGIESPAVTSGGLCAATASGRPSTPSRAISEASSKACSAPLETP